MEQTKQDAALTSNYDWVPGLPLMEQPKMLKGFFSIALVSLLMTIFEIVFYKLIVEPQTFDAANRIVELLENQMYYTGSTFPLNSVTSQLVYSMYAVDAEIDSYLDTARQREKLLIDKLNMYAYVTASCMILFLMALLVFLHMRLTIIKSEQNDPSTFGVTYWAAIVTSFATVCILGCFQVLFYFFGVEFKFLGSYGTQEIELHFINEVRKKMKKKEIPMS